MAGRASQGFEDELRRFAAARPGGWSHDDWLAFLDYLAERGHDPRDPDEVGRQLEQERLVMILEQVPGVGPKRIDELVERYGTLWHLRQAGVEELASLQTLNPGLARRVYEAVH